jgi:pimeloyl-ACP methyl ester carboxylesterase
MPAGRANLVMPIIGEISTTRSRRAGLGSSTAAAATPRTAGRALLGVLAAGAALLLVACGPPVGVSRVSPREVSRDLTRSALNSTTPSEFSENVLHRWNLRELFRRNPEAALARLHQLAGEGRGRDTTLFALAELSFAHADATEKRDYYLQAAVAAWAFLFPGGEGERPDEFDPRLRIAADVYNRGLTRALASADGSVVDLRSGLYPLPFGQQVAIHLAPDALRWADRELVEFVPVAELRVRGLGARHRRPGIGAPLAARAIATHPDAKRRDFLGPDARTPVTALLRIGEARRQLMQPVIHGSLQVYGSDRRSVEIDGREVRLEVEPSAALAWTLSQSQKWGWERRGFFTGDLLRQELPTSLTFAEPFRPGLIPVVLVHGTLSSAGRWADMLNDLENDGRIRDRFQFWLFHYSTGSPIPYSAMLLRDALIDAVAQLDPEGTDAALHQMVVVGHSQGGLLAKMLVVDSGTRIWDTISRRPLAELELSEQSRELLGRALFVHPLPFVRRVIFIATPHRGTSTAAGFLVRTITRFVTLPASVLSATADLLEGNSDDLVLDPRGPHFGSVYTMRPGRPFLQALAATPVAPGIAAHSIIPVRGAGPGPNATDGVVTYQSARIDGVDSELVIPFAGHSVQGHPLAIEEVRRILLEHAAAVCASSGIACGPELRGVNRDRGMPPADPVDEPPALYQR